MARDLSALLAEFQRVYTSQRAGCVYMILGQNSARVEYRQPSLEYRGFNAPTLEEALIEALEHGVESYGGKPKKAKPPAPEPEEDWGADLV